MSRKNLQVGVGGPGDSLIAWRGQQIDLPAALKSAEDLDGAVKRVVRTYLAREQS